MDFQKILENELGGKAYDHTKPLVVGLTGGTASGKTSLC